MYRIDGWNYRTGKDETIATNISNIGEAQRIAHAAANALAMTSRNLVTVSKAHGYDVERNGVPIYEITYIEPEKGWPAE